MGRKASAAEVVAPSTSANINKGTSAADRSGESLGSITRLTKHPNFIPLAAFSVSILLLTDD